ncbi:sugar transferase [Pedobacter sp. SYSU D00535]|uniref:sugar transferase n=1 Tax=Pedobacter sp. SYSU D00535 TaxID=2810308 RepID=UPI001A9677BE|nr:sugar transferase [Pedobacter sp. SYSU D00535]
MQNLAPIALFVYNRPEHTRRTLKFLQQNLLADESRLHIFSDAAKRAEDEAKVAEVRTLIRNIEGFKSVEVIERDINLGLANSIIDGVSKLVDEYGKVIVFEDDLISSSATLQYFNDALNRYEQEEKVMHIGAYMYPIDAAVLPETFFARIATSWGWATWKRAWTHFEPNIDTLITQFDSQKINDFSIDGTMNFWKQIQEFKSGKNNSWAIRWYASIFLKEGLSLNPASSLINNIGHDGTGVHSGVNSIYSVTVDSKTITEFPDELKEHPEAYLAIKSFLQKRKGNLWQRAMRFMQERMTMAKLR